MFIFGDRKDISMQQLSVIIVAGGSGTRMGSEVPKQFIEVKQKPILMHTIEAFYNLNHQAELIVVIPESQHKFWQTLIQKHNFRIAHKVVAGGKERYYSVKNGLAAVEKKGLVAVHDGVRPLVSAETIKKCIDGAVKFDAAIPVVPATESIRKVDGDKSEAVDRSKYLMVQTPQVFSYDLIQKAYSQDFSPLFTDDASMVENLGCAIHIVEGNVENIKITRPIDLKIAEVLL